MKYFFSVLLILAIILTMNIISLKNTKHSVDELAKGLNVLKNDIKQDNTDEITKKIKDLDKQWDNSNQLLSLYIEHEELDKAEIEFVNLKSCIDVR